MRKTRDRTCFVEPTEPSKASCAVARTAADNSTIARGQGTAHIKPCKQAKGYCSNCKDGCRASARRTGYNTVQAAGSELTHIQPCSAKRIFGNVIYSKTCPLEGVAYKLAPVL